jgi:uncharacterized protein (UPF0261 family)
VIRGAAVAEVVVAIVATLDTKGEEAAYLAGKLAAHGCRGLVIDVGTGTAPQVSPDITREDLQELADAGGQPLPRDSGAATAAMAEIAERGIDKLHERGAFAAVIALGGSRGTAVVMPALLRLPVGMPKVLVSTLAGRLGSIAATSDIFVVSPVADLMGLNRVTEPVLAGAAAAIAGMTASVGALERSDRAVALTALGVTTPAVQACMEGLRESKLEPIVFHANGAGGRSLEKMVRAGAFAGCLDLTTTEIVEEICGGEATAGDDRLTGAAEMRIAQVIAPGGIDMLKCRSGIPPALTDRRTLRHGPSTVLVRTSPAENHAAGRLIGDRARRAGTCAVVIVPRAGFSEHDRAGGEFFDPECVQAFERGALETAAPGQVVGLDDHINSAAFARTALSLLRERIDGPQASW